MMAVMDTPRGGTTYIFQAVMRTTPQAEQVADLLRAIGQVTRLAILEALRQGESCVSDLGRATGQGQSNLSRHLAFLRRAGVLSATRRGLRVFYRVAGPEVFALLDAAEVLLALEIRRRLATGRGRWAARLWRLRRAAEQILYGMTVFDMVMELRKAKGRKEELFTLVVFGPLLGVPIIPPYWALRLLSFVVDKLGPWRRSLMRERDFTDLIDQEIG